MWQSWKKLVVPGSVNNSLVIYYPTLKSQIAFRFVEVMNKSVVRCKLVDLGVR